MADDSQLPEYAQQDPQADVAAQGLGQALNKAAEHIGQNLDQYGHMVKSAIAGDPEAQMQLARHSLGIAMAGVRAPGNAAKIAESAPETIGVGSKPSQLTGKGLEYLQDKEGNIIGKFYNGNLMHDAPPISPDEPTVTAYADGGDVSPSPLPTDPDTEAAFQQAMSAAPASIYLQPSPQPSEQPQGPSYTLKGNHPVNVINPEGKVVSISSNDLPNALDNGYREASRDEVSKHFRKEKYGTTSQELLTALEGAGAGATFGLSTAAEIALGVPEEDIRQRRAENPLAHGLGEVTGLAASSLIPIAGEANILGRVGEAGAAALGAEAGAGLISQITNQTVRGAFEAALFQGGDEVSKAFTQDPEQTAQSAIADIGLSAVLGGVFGGTLGAAAAGLKKATPTFVSELDRPAIHSGDLRASIKHSDILKDSEKEGILASLGKEKAEAPEIRAAAKRLGAPVLEGMVSDSPLIQKAEDSLINGAPTFSGIKRANLYKEGYEKAAGVVDEALGEGSNYSKAELGNLLKKTITDQLSQENEPIKQMYSALKASHEIIPLPKNAASAISSEIKALPEFRVSPSSPEGALITRVSRELDNLKTVDDIKTYKSILSRSVSPTASSGEKRMASIIADKLNELEESSIEKFAKSAMPDKAEELGNLISQRKAANSKYKELIGKVQTLSEQLGKGRVYGLQDAINFIQNKLTPEEVTQRLFSKKDSEFLRFFNKEFPMQMELMRQYQKSALRDAASSTGQLSPKLLFNQVNKLEPEIQQSIFSYDELKKLKDAELYLRSFPKNFNPSGTSTMNAFRQAFEHPTGAALSNARDFAIEKFIKAVSMAPEVKSAQSLANATVKGFKLAAKASRAVLSPAKDAMPAAVVPMINHRDKLDKIVKDYQANPDKMTKINDNNPIPSYAAAFASTSARAVQYLSSLMPNTDPKAPLDSKMPALPGQKAAYNRALDIAQQPLYVLKHIKDGTIVPQDLVTLKTIYPKLYDQLNQQLTSEMIETVNKGKSIPYTTRLGLSMFMMQPLDSTMSPSSIMSAQPQPGGSPQQQLTSQPPAKHSTAGIGKMPSAFQTPEQSRAAERQKRAR